MKFFRPRLLHEYSFKISFRSMLLQAWESLGARARGYAYPDLYLSQF